MNKDYVVNSNGIDLHTHTTVSDGKYNIYQLLNMAIDEGLSAIAVTDHNSIHEDIFKIKEEYANKGLDVICASEVTGVYRTKSGKEEEIHIVALNIDPEKIKPLFEQNLKNRREYIEAIVDKLRQHNVADLDYDELLSEFDSHYIGKMHIAQKLANLGVVKNIYQGLDEYVGNLGKRTCYVSQTDYIKFFDIKKVVKIILESGGIPVLCHPYYYKSLSMEEREDLIAYFKEIGGVGIEVYYKDYNDEQITELERLADKYGLAKSAGSDFHGWKTNTKPINYNPSAVSELLKFISVESKTSF